MMKKLFAAAAILALPMTANAADLPLKARTVAAAPTAVNWSGAYLGGVAGMGMHTTQFVDPDENWTYAGMTNKGTAANVGVTGGYNWQFRSFVLGLEGDWSWTNYKKDTNGYDATTIIHSQWDWFATVRGRVGWAVDNVLLYATGGAAFAQIKHKAYYNYSPYGCGESGGYWSCPSSTQTGLAVGAGVEAMLWSNWSFKAEYLYISLPSVTTIDLGYPATWNDNAHIVRVGLNRHF